MTDLAELRATVRRLRESGLTVRLIASALGLRDSAVYAMIEEATRLAAHGRTPPARPPAAPADPIETWISTCCERRGQVGLTPAYRSYCAWCAGSGTVVLGRNLFGEALEAHGFTRGKLSHGGTVVFAGLSLVERKSEP
ncbi:MAG: hypothetical protein ACREUL_18625 [Steroidobacteraceae bacterium]